MSPVQIKSKLEQAHSQTSKPARLADKCIRLREERIGQDKVTDLVEESLVMELSNVKVWQMRIKTAIEQVRERALKPPGYFPSADRVPGEGKSGHNEVTAA